MRGRCGIAISSGSWRPVGTSSDPGEDDDLSLSDDDSDEPGEPRQAAPTSLMPSAIGLTFRVDERRERASGGGALGALPSVSTTRRKSAASLAARAGRRCSSACRWLIGSVASARRTRPQPGCCARRARARRSRQALDRDAVSSQRAGAAGTVARRGVAVPGRGRSSLPVRGAASSSASPSERPMTTPSSKRSLSRTGTGASSRSATASPSRLIVADGDAARASRLVTRRSRRSSSRRCCRRKRADSADEELRLLSGATLDMRRSPSAAMASLPSMLAAAPGCVREVARRTPMRTAKVSTAWTRTPTRREAVLARGREDAPSDRRGDRAAAERRRRPRRVPVREAGDGDAARPQHLGEARRQARRRAWTTSTFRRTPWRPFQLAFVLLNLPALADPTHPERSDPTEALVDLLWFPTGGGKTEAYLGLTAFALAIRRLQGRVGGLDGRRGVAVLMRYTLRLLTLQQFQRARRCCARASCSAARTTRSAWGAEPFRIGLWVGAGDDAEHDRDARTSAINRHGDAAASCTRAGRPDQLAELPVVRHARSTPAATSRSRRTTAARTRADLLRRRTAVPVHQSASRPAKGFRS